MPFRCQVCNARFRKRLDKPLHTRSLERRQYLRQLVQLPIFIRFHDGTTSTARAKNLSIGGCEIVGERALEQGATFTILMSGLLYCPERIDAEVAVVRTSREQRVGLKFLRLSEQNQEELGRTLYIAWKINRQA